MKKLSIAVVILVVLGGLFFYFRNKTDSGAVKPGTVANHTFHPDPSSATFIIDNNSLTLSQGENMENSMETTLLPERAYGDLNNDGKEDVVVFLTNSGGGSGVFVYVAGYLSGPVNYKGSNAFFLGDRISPQSISFKNGIATVNYLDRKPDEPFAAEPTISTSKQIIYKNGELEEKE